MLRVCLPCYITDRGNFSLYLEYRFCPQLCASPYYSRHLGSRLESSGTPLNDLLSYVFFLNSFNLQSRFYHFLFKLPRSSSWLCLPLVVTLIASVWRRMSVQSCPITFTLSVDKCLWRNRNPSFPRNRNKLLETYNMFDFCIVWRLSEDQVELFMKRRNIYVATSHRTLFKAISK